MYISITTITFLLINFYFLKNILPILKKFLPDLPNERSLHESPVPKGGGITFVIFTLLSSIFIIISGEVTFLTTLPVICFPLALIGFLDDFYDLNKLIRYFSQIITAVFILSNSEFINFSSNLTINSKSIFLIFFTILITSIINFTNFMDGIDGLVSGCISCGIFFIAISKNLPLNYWALIGSMIAFLIFNWQPAKLFMGDVGSTYLGAIYAGLSFNSSSIPELIFNLLIIFPLLADAITCILRRIFDKQNIFKAHSLHLYQRLCKGGFSHAKVSLIYILLIFLNGFFYLYFSLDKLIILCIIEFLFGLCLDKSKAIPFKLN